MCGSSIWSWFKCEECEFKSDTIETLDVHIGKCCYNYFECGLCDFRPGSLEDLKLHLVTCEVYECGNCVKRVKQLGKIKEHIEKEHKSEKYFHHLKMDRTDEEKVSSKKIYVEEV